MIIIYNKTTYVTMDLESLVHIWPGSHACLSTAKVYHKYKISYVLQMFGLWNDSHGIAFEPFVLPQYD